MKFWAKISIISTQLSQAPEVRSCYNLRLVEVPEFNFEETVGPTSAEVASDECCFKIRDIAIDYQCWVEAMPLFNEKKILFNMFRWTGKVILFQKV
jgi:hypothetical protein